MGAEDSGRFHYTHITGLFYQADPISSVIWLKLRDLICVFFNNNKNYTAEAFLISVVMWMTCDGLKEGLLNVALG